MPEPEIIAADDGWPLAVRHWPGEQKRGIVLLVHDLREDAEYHVTTCAQLADSGLDVYAFDLRGHGQSAEPIDLGLVEPRPVWSTLVAGLDRVRRHALETTGPDPVFLVGLGVGADLVQSVAQSRGRQYTGIVLIGPSDMGAVRRRLMRWFISIECWRRGATAPAGWFHERDAGAYKKRAGDRWWNGLRWIPRLNARSADDSDAQRKTVLRLQTVAGVLAGQTKVRRRANRLRMPRALPILILAGRDDPYGQYGQTPAKLARVFVNDGLRDVSRRCYVGARHDLLAGRVGDDALDDLSAWIESRLAPELSCRPKRDSALVGNCSDLLGDN